jgi:ATP-binding cassette subfamily B protein RaxB
MRHAVWQNKLSESLGAAFAHERIRASQAAASTLLTGLETVLIVWLGAGFAIDGQLSVGMLFAFLAYRLHFATTTKNLIDRGIDLQMLSLHLERLSDIALTREDQGFFEPETAPDDLRGEIELKGVTYAYGIHDPQVLTGVDLKVAPGEHVAITGPSGGGKTTLAKIILGLLEPTSGEVLVDGAPLQQMGRRAFREQVAAVLQDDLLFAGTIADNVAGFDEIDTARLDEALQAAAVADDIARMPMKHLTLVGDMGSALSGGQRQRILLARALYRRPRLLVVDEGTAHLDLAHERVVNRNIAAMGITRIVIAHRRETIEAADRVITLADGKADGGTPIARRRPR